MGLSAEDRDRIYEEEKVRHEARVRLKSEANARKTKLLVIGVLVAAVLAVILFVIAEVEAISDRKFQAWMMMADVVPRTVGVKGLLSGDEMWTKGEVKLPAYRNADIAYEGNDTYAVAASFELRSKEQHIENHFHCRLRYLGSALLEDESPASMAPNSAAAHLNYRCHPSTSGRYSECEYWDIIDLQFALTPSGRSR